MKETPSNLCVFHSGMARRGLTKTECLLGIALAVVILGSLGMAFYPMFTSGNAASDKPMPNTRYKCEKCQFEFEFDPLEKEAIAAESTQGRPQGTPSSSQSARGCPKCKAKDSCWLMHRCGKCDKAFAQTASERDPRNSGQPISCPHCQTVLGK